MKRLFPLDRACLGQNVVRIRTRNKGPFCFCAFLLTPVDLGFTFLKGTFVENITLGLLTSTKWCALATSLNNTSNWSQVAFSAVISFEINLFKLNFVLCLLHFVFLNYARLHFSLSMVIISFGILFSYVIALFCFISLLPLSVNLSVLPTYGN